jgi:hypothetical protein
MGTMLAAAVAIWMQDPGTYDLLPNPQYGHWEYRMHRLVLHLPGAKTEYAMRARQRVVAIRADGSYDVLFETRRSVSFVNGKPADTPFRKERVVTYVPKGWYQPSFLPGENGRSEAASLSAFRAPPSPVRIGQSWTYSATGEPGYSVTYTLVGPSEADRIPCMKVTSEARQVGTERPASAKGQFWVATASGIVVQASHKFEGLRLAGRPTDGMLVYEPTDPALFEKGQ